MVGSIFHQRLHIQPPMGRRTSTSLRDVVGKLKDTASQSKAALNPLSKPHVGALLRATTHDPSAPPDQKHLAELLSYGHRSRAKASVIVESLMDRLQTTGDAAVALKCLMIVHHIIRRGTFILQDQLSVFPAAGGRNYLKLSNFRDNRSTFTWELSSWVRWYARYIENLLSASRILGFFIGSSSSILEKDKIEETVTSQLNSDLLRELDSLVGLIEETCRMPESLHLGTAELLHSVKLLATEDHASVTNEVSVRVSEFRERIGLLSFGESVELVCALKRLEGCEGKASAIFDRKVSVEGFWRLMREVKRRLAEEEEEKMTMAVERRVGRWGSESARLGRRWPPTSAEPVKFSSGRWLSLPIKSAENYG